MEKRFIDQKYPDLREIATTHNLPVVEGLLGALGLQKQCRKEVLNDLSAKVRKDFGSNDS